MHVLLTVLGVLPLVFGGGCTLLIGGLFISDPQSMMSDAAIILSYWLPLGLAPLAGGFLLMQHGIRQDRERRARAAAVAKERTGKEP